MNNSSNDKVSQAIDKLNVTLKSIKVSLDSLNGTSTNISKSIEKVVGKPVLDGASGEVVNSEKQIAGNIDFSSIISSLTKLENSVLKFSTAIKNPIKTFKNAWEDAIIEVLFLAFKTQITFKNVWKSISGGVSNAANSIVKVFTNIGNHASKIGSKIMANYSRYGPTLGTLVNGFKGVTFVLTNTFGTAFDMMDKGLMAFLEGGMNALSKINWTNIKKAWRSGVTSVTNGALSIIKKFKKTVESLKINPKAIGKSLENGFKIINEGALKAKNGLTSLKDGLSSTTKILKDAGVESKFLNGAVTGLTAVITIMSTAQQLAAGAQWALNVAMNANPIGLIIAGVVALVGVVMYAWNNFEGFRGTIIGMWEVLKSFGTVIKDYVINRFKELLSGITGIGAAILKFFKGDWEGAWQVGKQAVTELIGVESANKAAEEFVDAGRNAVTNFNKGYKEGVDNNFRFSVPESLNPNKKKEEKKSAIIESSPVKVPAGFNSAGGSMKMSGKTINVQSLVENLNINVNNLRESSAEVKDHVKKVLLDALRDTEIAVIPKTNR
ncbi:hypothetical protein J8281_15045 [Aquimarina sp. U1-2]|uniref:hypothetical protein n=1 Tax=Aquimarina sp. U1-2 TaxID=2823141 RepID=UPI001AEC90D7|nr:hypothetical protein [Aquimarina sp. U1-2]MBP2833510.1 hypothetical protein [Aquimarina sp. U1-2]